MSDFTSKKINIEQFKDSNAINHLQGMIKKRLKVSASHSNTLDIKAAAMGAKDYQTLKGVADKPFYVIKCNLGTTEQPFYVERELGYHDSDYEPYRLAHIAIKDCAQFQFWTLHKNGVPTGHTIETTAKPKRGLEVQITLTGDTEEDISLAFEEASRHTDCYYASERNDTGSYTVRASGDEYDPLEDDENEAE